MKTIPPQAAAPSAAPTRPRSYRGFTLVELLVVIAIIAVLAALISMGVKNARASANSVTAVSRLRAYGVANESYASDNSGRYVQIYAFDEDAVIGTVWYKNWEFFSYIVGDDAAYANEGKSSPDWPEDLLDPVTVKTKARLWITPSASFGYINSNMPGGNWGVPNTKRGWHSSRVHSPARMAQFITCTDWIAKYNGRFLWQDSPNEGKTSDGKIAYRHRGRAVVVFYDGHTELISPQDMKKFDDNGGKNNVFWGGKGQ